MRAIVADQFGNTTNVDTSNVPVDNTAPSILSTTPADGSVQSSVSSMSLTASKNLSAVNSLKLDGVVPTFTPSISGATVTFNVGSLAPGTHALTGRIVDAGGVSAPFRLNVTIPYGDGTVAETAKNVSSVVATTLGAADNSATVTVPANNWQQPLPGPQDFLVLHVEPTPPASGLQGGLQFASMPLNVWMNWELAGWQEHHFDAPLEIVLTDSTGGSGYPVTFENNAWRTIQLLDAPGVLPASWQDGYWRDHGSVHILTRHLSLFALLNSLTGTAPPSDAGPDRTKVDLGTPPTVVARSPLLFTVSLAPRVRLTQATFAARVLVSSRARIDVTLDARPFRRIQRWHYLRVNCRGDDPAAQAASEASARQLPPFLEGHLARRRLRRAPDHAAAGRGVSAGARCHDSADHGHRQRQPGRRKHAARRHRDTAERAGVPVRDLPRRLGDSPRRRQQPATAFEVVAHRLPVDRGDRVFEGSREARCRCKGRSDRRAALDVSRQGQHLGCARSRGEPRSRLEA